MSIGPLYRACAASGLIRFYFWRSPHRPWRSHAICPDCLATMIIITLLLVIVVILKARQPFQGPRGWPIVGHLPYLLQRDFHRVIRSWSDRYGAVYGMHVLGLPGFVVSDPASIGLVLCRTVDRPEVPKHTASYRELDVLWGGRSSIFTSDSNETWRLVRKSVASAFSSAMMRYGRDRQACNIMSLILPVGPLSLRVLGEPAQNSTTLCVAGSEQVCGGTWWTLTCSKAAV